MVSLKKIEKETFLRDCQLREGSGLSKEHREGDIPEGLSTQEGGGLLCDMG